jgi:Rad3-related DNA helicase
MCDYENLSDYFPFATMRPGQSDILDALKSYLLNPKIKYILVEAGTGSGKSPIAITAASAAGSAYVATANKFLQDQYMRDFSDVLVDLKGRGNYRCYQHKVPDSLVNKIGEFYNCINSPCQHTDDGRKGCAKNKGCEYHKQLDKASDAPITSFNFASALAFLNYLPDNFSKRKLLVCDECHNIPNWITNFISVEFSLDTLVELGLKDRLPDYACIDDYSGYLYDVQKATNKLLNLDKTLEPNVVIRLETLSRRFRLFDKITNGKKDMGNFIVEKTYDLKDKSKILTLSFKPVVISSLVDTYLFSHAEKTLLLSATILDFPTYMDLMGIPRDQAAIIRVPTTFPAKNRPIYTNQLIGYLNQKNLDANLPVLVDRIKHILAAYPSVKGIIHGTTYKICNYIFENLDSDRLLFPKTAQEQKKIIDKHISSTEPTILLSPSMTEGVDLAGDISELQILAKMPYAYLGDPVLKRRMEIYPNYYNMLTALTLAQSYGRSIRSETDRCDTYPLDSCFLSFIRSNSSIFPPSFLEAIQR